jgi:Raf kinase inhibitor-like YbhB/YbcL family protein
MTFRIFSNDLEDGDTLPMDHVLNGMGYEGGNVSPHLAWEGVPDGTKSFVVTMYDPDAPTGSGWWHWVVANLPGSARDLDRGAGSPGGSLPAPGLQTRTDFGVAGYGGAAPPNRSTHRYVFAVHALGVEALDVHADTGAAMVGIMVHNNKIDSASIQVTFV